VEDGYQKLMQGQDWKRVILEILHYCISLFKRDGKSQDRIIAQGHLAEDMASKAIELVISGKRKWEPGRGELILFLKHSVIRSLRSNVYKIKENSMVDCLEAYYGTEEDGILTKEKIAENLRVSSAEEIAIYNEELSLLRNEFQAAVSDMTSEEVQGIFDCLTEGISKPRDMETLTGVPARRISEVKRQIKNKLRGTNHESR
jgi:hypothetical protein